MVLVKLVALIRRWYHANDEVFLSQQFQQQRARDIVDFYVHVGDSPNARTEGAAPSR